MDVNALVFSKNRAMQLLALLQTLEKCCAAFDKLSCSVLYKTTTEQHMKQYQKLQAAYPKVTFLKETEIEKDIHSYLNTCQFIMFLVDDCLFVNDFSTAEAVQKLQSDISLCGVSLRLGNNISYCYPFGCEQKRPAFIQEQNFLKYKWTEGEYDFGYPFDVSSSIYRSSDILKLIKGNKITGVNQFEGLLYNRRAVLNCCPYLACYETSRAFCNPMNITADNKNRHSNKEELSIQSLADKFDEGLRISSGLFKGFVPNGCHQEIDVVWEYR